LDHHVTDCTESSSSTSSTRLPIARSHRSHNSQASNIRFTCSRHALTMSLGCADDVAAIELVNWDNGDEYTCSDIPLQPDGTPETSTCDIEKDQMVSGTWGLILVSNNGPDPDSPPFANQRTFSLDVGVQATSTVSFSIRVCGWDTELTDADYTYNNFQHDDYTNYYVSNYIMGCQHHYCQQLHDHYPTCSK
jgi:hypothetical protein